MNSVSFKFFWKWNDSIEVNVSEAITVSGISFLLWEQRKGRGNLRDKGEKREWCATQEVDGGKISFALVLTDQKNRRGKKRDETRRGGLVPLEGCYVCARMWALPGWGSWNMRNSGSSVGISFAWGVRAWEEDVRTFLDLGLHHTWKSCDFLHLQSGTMLKVQLREKKKKR